jgi:hypothetical protein
VVKKYSRERLQQQKKRLNAFTEQLKIKKSDPELSEDEHRTPLWPRSASTTN